MNKRLEDDLQLLTNWTASIKLSINNEKTKEMIFGRYSSHLIVLVTLGIGITVDDFHFSGSTLDVNDELMIKFDPDILFDLTYLEYKFLGFLFSLEVGLILIG
jgi:hypothetical protein